MPVQRIPRYVMLLEDLLLSTPTDHEDYPDVKLAVEKINLICVYVNEKKRDAENLDLVLGVQDRLQAKEKDSHFKKNLSEAHRRYIKEGPLFVYGSIKNLPIPNITPSSSSSSSSTTTSSTSSTSSTNNNNNLDSIRQKLVDQEAERYCVLFNDLLMETKVKKKKLEKFEKQQLQQQLQQQPSQLSNDNISTAASANLKLTFCQEIGITYDTLVFDDRQNLVPHGFTIKTKDNIYLYGSPSTMDRDDWSSHLKRNLGQLIKNKLSQELELMRKV